MRFLVITITAFLLFSCQGEENKEEKSKDNKKDEKNAQAESKSSKSYPTSVYFGDTHLHTNLSMDAAGFGNTLGIDEAYRFAKGEEVTSSTGVRAKLSRPLDFLVVADHSDGMGLTMAIGNGEEWVMKTDQGKRWHEMMKNGENHEMAMDLIKNFSQGTLDMDPNDPKLMTSVWSKTIEAAEKYNDPGKFTAFIGYEWTSLIAGNNLHRVVIYRDNGDKAKQQLPFTNGASSDPEDLWENLQQYENKTGGKVLAIPHNGNLSNGIMFAETTVAGEPLTKDYAQRRMRWEPLYEITQCKGDGEAHPFLSPNDEFANYETWDFGNLDLSAKKTNAMLVGEYGRSALKLGLKFKADLGVNPFKYGFIGSTDNHVSLAAAEDNNYFGKTAQDEPSATRWKFKFMDGENGTIFGWNLVASGYAAVWATENTREAIWDAMMRKETYATTGSRMQVRFFGGWEYTEADMESDFVKAGYEKGVPMGGDLFEGAEKTPSFIVHALMDPESGSLDRIQIVKGWLTPDGKVHEKVFDVVWAGDRKADATGKVPKVKNTVNIKDGSWDNSTGSTSLSKVWTDPEFDPNLEAFYYVRVIEIPTPRWTLYDILRYGAKPSKEVPLTVTQRGYTSPIWYSPMK